MNNNSNEISNDLCRLFINKKINKVKWNKIILIYLRLDMTLLLDKWKEGIILSMLWKIIHMKYQIICADFLPIKKD